MGIKIGNKNLIQIDPDQMPVTMTLQSSQATVIPRQFSATMVNFTAQHSSMYVLRISSPHGQLPMGAEIRNAKQQLVAILNQQICLDQQTFSVLAAIDRTIASFQISLADKNAKLLKLPGILPLKEHQYE